MGELEGQVAIVTGGGRDIDRAPDTGSVSSAFASASAWIREPTNR
jgi:hypothetical protein